MAHSENEARLERENEVLRQQIAGASGSVALSESERAQLTEILTRRSNEIASFRSDLKERIQTEAGKPIRLGEFPGSVELALDREITRLRSLADKVRPPRKPEQDED